MTTISLTLQYDDETIAAIEKRRMNDPIDVFLKGLVDAECARYVETDFNAAVERLRVGAKSLPFEQRVALIEQVEQAISKP